MNAARLEVDPEILLLRQSLRGRRDLRDRLALDRAGEIHHRHVARRRRTFHRLEIRLARAQQFHRALHVRVRHRRRFAFRRQALVFRQLKLRRRLHRRRELQRLSPAELDFLDVRIAHHFQLLFIHRLAIRVGDQFLFDLVAGCPSRSAWQSCPSAPCPDETPATPPAAENPSSWTRTPRPRPSTRSPPAPVFCTGPNFQLLRSQTCLSVKFSLPTPVFRAPPPSGEPKRVSHPPDLRQASP